MPQFLLRRCFSAIRNPGSFYYSNVTPRDWTLPQNDALWREGTKTLFDPCPSGWRVPPSGEGTLSPWCYFSLEAMQQVGGDRPDRAGAWYGSPIVEAGPVWYPNAGRHTFTDGTLVNFGREGVCWSSSTFNTDVLRFLYHSAPESRPTDTGYRSAAFSVRCIRE